MGHKFPMHRYHLRSAASLFSLAPSTVMAQDANDPDQDRAADVIVVTGEKIDRTVQETASSVVVTTQERIADANIQTLEELFERTANLAQTYGDSGFNIRGIANKGIQSGGEAQLTKVYVDGAALPQGLTGYGPTDTLDLTQVEVFRGPQSTLQGLNALAGAIVIRTQDPTFTGKPRAASSSTRTRRPPSPLPPAARWWKTNWPSAWRWRSAIRMALSKISPATNPKTRRIRSTCAASCCGR